ncbi:MAG: acyl-ACP--UDP-N-acetylglucosamine O-acyltransferase, partial [Legionella sp.]
MPTQHDCIVGNNVIMAKYTSLAGHVEVGDYCIIGGHSAILQFVRLGKYAMIGGMTGVTNDVTPYGMVFGNRAVLCGLNVVGLKRHGFSKNEIKEIR